MNDLMNGTAPNDTYSNHIALKCLETVLEHPAPVIAVVAIISCTILTATAINAKYGRETTITVGDKDKIEYISKPKTTNNSASA